MTAMVGLGSVGGRLWGKKEKNKKGAVTMLPTTGGGNPFGCTPLKGEQKGTGNRSASSLTTGHDSVTKRKPSKLRPNRGRKLDPKKKKWGS